MNNKVKSHLRIAKTSANEQWSADLQLWSKCVYRRVLNKPRRNCNTFSSLSHNGCEHPQTHLKLRVSNLTWNSVLHFTCWSAGAEPTQWTTLDLGWWKLCSNVPWSGLGYITVAVDIYMCHLHQCTKKQHVYTKTHSVCGPKHKVARCHSLCSWDIERHETSAPWTATAKPVPVILQQK